MAVKDKTISIVIRTMPGREEYLDRCLFILSGQTYKQIQPIVVVQNSYLEGEQSTLEGGSWAIDRILKQWAPFFDSMILVSHTADYDARSRSLNIGMQHSEGQYLAFLDDDDKVYPNHYESLVMAITSANLAWGYCDVVLALYNIDGQLIKRSLPFKRDSYSFLEHLKQNFIPIHSFVIDRFRASDIGCVNEKFSRNEDYEFILRLASKHEPIYLPVIGAEYCVREDGSNTIIPGTTNSKQLRQKKTVWSEAESLLDKAKEENFGWWVHEVNNINIANGLHAPFQVLTDSNYRSILREYHSTISFRLGLWVQKVFCRLFFLKYEGMQIPNTDDEAYREIQRILKSKLWAYTKPLRTIRRIKDAISIET